MEEVTSPCTGVCEIDVHTRWCKGCLRTLDEIAAWGQMGMLEKKRLLGILFYRRNDLLNNLKDIKKSE